MKTVIVVGAGGAIGSVIVDRLVSRGVKVVGVGREAERMSAQTERHGDAFVTCPADIGSDTAIELIRAALAGPVAAVVSAAGVAVAGGVVDAPTEAIVSACNIKVAGFMRLVRAADKKLGRGSRLIAIGGHYGFEPSPYAATAGVANAALANLIRQMSWAYGDRGITAHLLAPGPADTERLHRVAADRAVKAGRSVKEELATMQRESAIGAFTTPEQIAWAVNLLLDPEADALAGSTLALDSGRRRGIS